MNQTATGQTTQQEQQLQPLQTPYSVRADYVGIALAFFILGYFIAYKTAINVSRNINPYYNHPRG